MWLSATMASQLPLLLGQISAWHACVAGFEAKNAPGEALNLISSEKRSIFSARDLLRSFQDRPDCFRDAAANIGTRCGKPLAADHHAKVYAAIELTRCELATADQQMPLECSLPSETHAEAARPPDFSPCVAALSRSAQYWSTYSGYLREVPSLCFALRHEHEETMVMRLYRKMTHEKESLLAALERMRHAQERRSHEAEEAMNAHITEMGQALEQHSKAFAAGIESMSRAGDRVAHQAAETTQQSYAVLGRQIQVLLDQGTHELATASRQAVAHLSHLLEQELDRSASSHFDALMAVTHTVQSELRQALELHRDDLRDTLTLLQQTSDDLARTVHRMKMELDVLTQQAQDMSIVLSTGSTAAQSLLEDVVSTKAHESLRIARLEDALKELVQMAEAGVERRRALVKLETRSRAKGLMWRFGAVMAGLDPGTPWLAELVETIQGLSESSFSWWAQSALISVLVMSWMWSLFFNQRTRASQQSPFHIFLRLCLLALRGAWALAGCVVTMLGSMADWIARDRAENNRHNYRKTSMSYCCSDSIYETGPLVRDQQAPHSNQERCVHGQAASTSLTSAVDTWLDFCKRDKDQRSDAAEVDELLSTKASVWRSWCREESRSVQLTLDSQCIE